jgi:hypothetical protein
MTGDPAPEATLYAVQGPCGHTLSMSLDRARQSVNKRLIREAGVRGVVVVELASYAEQFEAMRSLTAGEGCNRCTVPGGDRPAPGAVLWFDPQVTP